MQSSSFVKLSLWYIYFSYTVYFGVALLYSYMNCFLFLFVSIILHNNISGFLLMQPQSKDAGIRTLVMLDEQGGKTGTKFICCIFVSFQVFSIFYGSGGTSLWRILHYVCVAVHCHTRFMCATNCSLVVLLPLVYVFHLFCSIAVEHINVQSTLNVSYLKLHTPYCTN